MTQAIIFGFGWGFLLCFTFGPAFFRLIQSSIDNGFRTGVLIALGVVGADALQMFFAVFGTSILPKIRHFDMILSIGGATLLLVLGIRSIFAKTRQLIYPKTKFSNIIYYFSSGFFLNILNPSNVVAVFATSTYLKEVLDFTLNDIILFFLFSLIGTFLAESLISFYAQKMKKVLTKNVINRINQAAGVVFIFSALLILWKQFIE
ncbi:Threonine/homoserine/homoserine lactone efflux protein [Pseudarcicella hirudinis]|uniref:Threonine/homoserine/homoserine lactone efflux protein n=1 Tax=Pseudarcicella hirudinis TaxID=1079859 RepID=A0A1I5N1W6_9BACT|nr:LysE family transporter [Pseudarcicella hirudinis]SFP15828.1 Threonine/homoserine/homoserine lactone efflux protein [Pseudarcicella hirudinis]